MALTERAKLIAEKQKQIPRDYRATFKKAVSGKSLRAAINAFCIECVGYQRKEVTLCTSLACPLYAVRPYQCPQKAPDGGFSGAKSNKSGEAPVTALPAAMSNKAPNDPVKAGAGSSK